MAVDSIGSVSVDIRGDYSRLQADFAGAQALATKAGASIASGLTAGMAPAAAQAGVVLDKFGVAFKSVAAGATAATPPVLNLNAGIQRLIIAQEMLRVAYAETTPAVEAQNAAMAHGVSQIQATSGAIRVLEGSQGIRAVERFLISIPGIGAALQAAFPLIGAIALFEMISRVVGKVNELSEAEKHLAEVTKQTDEEFKRLGTELEHIRIEELTTQFGKLSGIPVKQFFDVSNIREAQAELSAMAGKIALAKQNLADTNELFAQELSITRALQDVNPVIGAMRARMLMDFGSGNDQIKNIKGLEREYDVLADKIRNLTAQKDLDAKTDTKLTLEQTGQLQSAQVGAREKINQALSAQNLKRIEIEAAQNLGAEQIRILGIADAGNRAIAEAEEELRVAQDKAGKLQRIYAQELSDKLKAIQGKADADKLGKTPPEQERIQTTATGEEKAAKIETGTKALDVLKDIDAAERKLGEAHVIAERGWAEQTTREWDKSYDARLKKAQEFFVQQNIGAANATLLGEALAEIGAKSKGDTDALDTLHQKIALQGQYAAQLSHTNAQQITQAQSLAALDSKARQDEIAGLEKKMQAAAAVMHPITDPKSVEEAKQIGEQWAHILDLRGKANNDDLKAANDIAALIRSLDPAWQAAHVLIDAATAWKQIGAGTVALQFAQAGTQVPGAIGGAVAGGLFSSGKQGMDIGKQIGDAMKNIGKQLAGELIADAIKKLLAQVIISTGLQAALNALFPVTASAQTIALLAGLPVPITAGILAASAVTTGTSAAAGGLASAGGGLAAGAGGAASSAASGLIGPLIAAAGGIIGGVISGVMSLIGAHQIVTAIHGTTAAVQALHGTVSGTSGPVTSGVPSAPAASTGGASQGGLMGFFSSILGFGSSSKPIDVNVVAFSPISPLKGLFNLFGFASGGRPPMGMASIVGERGPELFIPDQAGTVIPAGKWGGMAPGLPSISGVPSTSHSIGSMSFTVNGVTNPKEFVRQVARELPGYLKSTAPGYSPASR